MQKYKLIIILLFAIAISFLGIVPTAHAGGYCVPVPSKVEWKEKKSSVDVRVTNNREIPFWVYDEYGAMGLISATRNGTLPYARMWCMASENSEFPKTENMCVKRYRCNKGASRSITFKADFKPMYVHVYSDIISYSTGVWRTVLTKKGTYKYEVNPFEPRFVSAYPSSVCSHTHPNWESMHFSRGVSTSWGNAYYSFYSAGNPESKAGWKGLISYLETPTKFCSSCPWKTVNGEKKRVYCANCSKKEAARTAAKKYWKGQLSDNYPTQGFTDNLNITVLFGMYMGMTHNQYHGSAQHDEVSGGDFTRTPLPLRHCIPQYSYHQWYTTKPSIGTVKAINSNRYEHNGTYGNVKGFWPDRYSVAHPGGYGEHYLGVKAVGYNGLVHAAVFGPYIRKPDPPTIAISPEKRDWTKKEIGVTITYSSDKEKLSSTQYCVTKNSNPPVAGSNEWSSAGSNSSTIKQKITLSAEGVWYIHAKCSTPWWSDGVTKSCGSYKIDLSSPRISADPDERTEAGITDPINVTLSFTDYLESELPKWVVGSGIAKYRYKWTNNTEWDKRNPGSWDKQGDWDAIGTTKDPFNNPLPKLSQETYGVWYLYAQAIDKVGNESKVEKFGPYYYINLMPPTFKDGTLDRKIRITS